MMIKDTNVRLKTKQIRHVKKTNRGPSVHKNWHPWTDMDKVFHSNVYLACLELIKKLVANSNLAYDLVWNS